MFWQNIWKPTLEELAIINKDQRWLFSPFIGVQLPCRRLYDYTIKINSSISNSSGTSSKKTKNDKKLPECKFCIENGEEFVNHLLKDAAGNVVCPVLRKFRCRKCGATGANAHTQKYCPENPLTQGDPKSAGFPPGLLPPEFQRMEM